MKETLWELVAWAVSCKPVANYLINRSKRTPYYHLDGYMNRWWLFNRYSEVGTYTQMTERFSFLPSIRVHQILRKDLAEHLHDHPWDARTIILRGFYVETREDGKHYTMSKGDTRAIKFGEYHHIDFVTKCEPVYTLFITWKYIGTWGFLVDGNKVPWQEYVAEHPERT